ncbi:hypothetical protein [Streptomyces cavernicola]|uniref:Uncharacterized protein n=1 Tax=Streptomyces cavernicola TaxID=3043613 RepID=A0ABT6SHN1_9ACTN|nr:hypothetical protein [Streptomyces sp. B-S-A6]MDI3407706.1 hypothetical protein [Streptomyces sp. B-S-A6]
MTSSTPPIQIHVLEPDDNDVPLTDVGVVTIDGQRHLFLSPQSFGSAVRQVSSAMPDLPLEQVERLVREHCTEFKDFDELLGPIEPAPPVDIPPPPVEPPASVHPRGRAKRWAVAAALIPAFAGTWALGHFTSDGSASTASAPDTVPSIASDDQAASDNRNLGPEPFTAREFMDFSDAGKIDCSPIDNLEAECTDSDGMVMATKAATGPDSTIFTFSYGSERLGLRIFGTADYARTWTKQDGSRELYPNLVRSGRYVLWGTDKSRLKEYLGLLETWQSKATAVGLMHTMGAAEPLPPRLAALTLGTLGLDEEDVHTILFSPQSFPVDAPVLMAAQAVLGVNGDDAPQLEPGADDIVALAAGIEPPAVVADPDQSAHTGGGVVPVTDPVESSGSASAGGTAEQSTGPATGSEPQPTETEKPKEPVAEEKPEEPVAEKPTEPEPTSVVEPTPEQPPTEPAKPSEPEQPTAPAHPALVDPAPPVTETPAPPQDPDPAETQPTDDGGDAAGELPPVDEHAPNADHEDDRGRELRVLPEAWITPAA